MNMIQHLNRHPSPLEYSSTLSSLSRALVSSTHLSDSDRKPLSHPIAQQQTLKKKLHVKQKMPFNSPRSSAITSQIGKFILTDLRPYTVVEKQGFKELLHVLEPKYEACNIDPTIFMSCQLIK